MTDILLATGNSFKQRKFREIFDGMPVNLILPDQTSHRLAVEETGATFRENAELKAQTWSRVVDGFAVSTDGGMDIPVLGPRWDPVRTGRFGGEGLTPEERALKLLELMKPYRGEDRKLLWFEAAAVARRGEILASWEFGGDEGYLMETFQRIDHPKNLWGDWWVGSLWHYPRFGKTYAELTDEELAAVDVCWRSVGLALRTFFA